MPEPKSKPVVVLPPPVFSLSPLSSKYELILDLKWGILEKQVKIDRETFNFEAELIKKLNQELLEGSESNPFISK